MGAQGKKEDAACEAPSEGQVAKGRVQKRKRHEAKPERSTRRDERRELMMKAKSVWEALRPKATGKEKSQKLVAELIRLLKGRVVEFVFRHDGSRIVQWMLAEGNEEQKAAVLDELEKGAEKRAAPGDAAFFVRLATDRYAKHLAMKLMRASDKSRRTHVYERYIDGNVGALMKSAAGADVLDMVFQTVLSAPQRGRTVVELLFAREPKFLEAIRAKRVMKEGGVSNFSTCVDILGAEFRKPILEAASATLSAFVDKDSMLRMNVVHCALRDYMDVVVSDGDAVAAREMASLLCPSLVHLTHTKAGAHLAVTAVKLTDAKGRKKAMRSLKGHVRKVAEDEFGHRVVLALLEWMDDTKLSGNIFFTEYTSKSKITVDLAGEEDADDGAVVKSKKNAQVDVEYLLEAARNKHARMPLLHVLVWKQTRYFHPQGYGFIWKAPNEEHFGKTSKKEGKVRQGELLAKVRDGLKALFEEHMDDLLMNTFSAPLAIGGVQDEQLCDCVADNVGSLLTDSERRTQLMGNICGRKTLATLLKVGGATFADSLVERCGPEITVTLALDSNCIGCVKNLLMATEKSEAALAVTKAKSRIKKANAVNERSKTLAQEVVSRAQALASFDSAIGAK